jgi:hypothetical protein
MADWRQRLGPDDAGEAGPVDDTMAMMMEDRPGPEDGDQEDGEEDRREGHPDVDEARDDEVHPARGEAREEAQVAPRSAVPRPARTATVSATRAPQMMRESTSRPEGVGAEEIAGLGPRGPERGRRPRNMS